MSKVVDAPDILHNAAEHIANRAATRDMEQERSMHRAVAMFNAYRAGKLGTLTEVDGWVFMALLKLARSAQGDLNLDDYEDGAAYIALAGEAAQ